MYGALVHLRPMTAADLPIVQRTLYLALAWDGLPDHVTGEMVLEHPHVAIYHEHWGRPGDVGVVAEVDGATVGAAFGRLFTDQRHGHGYVDPDTPEIGIAVEPEHTGNGIGTILLAALEEAYRAGGVSRLSLSVNLPNPALRLYERVGYEELDRDTDSARMLKEL